MKTPSNLHTSQHDIGRAYLTSDNDNGAWFKGKPE